MKDQIVFSFIFPSVYSPKPLSSSSISHETHTAIPAGASPAPVRPAPPPALLHQILAQKRSLSLSISLCFLRVFSSLFVNAREYSTLGEFHLQFRTHFLWFCVRFWVCKLFKGRFKYWFMVFCVVIWVIVKVGNIWLSVDVCMQTFILWIPLLFKLDSWGCNEA